jgi:dTDP-glucose 4,6-dehydratase
MHMAILHAKYNLPIITIRPSSIYGPAQKLSRLIPKATYCALSGYRFCMEGLGQVHKSYVHACDLSRAIYLALHKGHLGNIYNVGSDNFVNVHQMLDLICDKLNIRLANLAEVVAPRDGDDDQRGLDSSKIKSELGYKEAISLEQGIDDMINWGRKCLDLLHDEPRTFTLRA